MITMPVHDLPTRSASGYILRYVAPRSYPPHQLFGLLDRRQLFNLAIGDSIIGTGHGSPTQFAGHNNQIILDLESIPNVKGKTVILLSCETAQQLGPALIRAGAASYIGWKEDFIWVMDADLVSTPWKDKWAEPVMLPVMNCMNAVLDGKSTREAFNIMTESFKANLEVEDEDFVKSCLEFNIENAVLLGDGDKKIRPVPKIRLPLPPPPIILPLYEG